jgi:hypothetical protein
MPRSRWFRRQSRGTCRQEGISNIPSHVAVCKKVDLTREVIILKGWFNSQKARALVRLHGQVLKSGPNHLVGHLRESQGASSAASVPN